MKIWHLDFEIDEFDNLIPVKELSLDKIQSFNGSSKKELWKAMNVMKMEDKKLSNATGFYSHIPVFNKVTLKTVIDLIGYYVEVLPLAYTEGELNAINVIEVLNGIDKIKPNLRRLEMGNGLHLLKLQLIKNIFSK